MNKYMILAAGGAIGTLLRFSVADITHKLTGGTFPWGTLAVNLSGSFIIGLLWGIFSVKALSPDLRNFVFIGILGGYTTFSTFTIECFNLIRDNHLKLAVLNLLASNILGIVLVFAGFFISKSALNFIR